MKRILSPFIIIAVMAAWCSPGFAVETDSGVGPFVMSTTGETQGVAMIGQGGGGTLDVGLDVYNGNELSPGVATNSLLPAITTDVSSESDINFIANSTVYGYIGGAKVFLNLVDTSFNVNLLGAVNATSFNVGTGTVNFESGTSNSTATNFTGDGTISLAANTTVIGALTNNTANTGTLSLASGSELNGAVGGASGLKAINVVGGNNISGVSATISGAVDTYSISLLTNTLNIDGALTMANGGTGTVINSTVASSMVYGHIIPGGAVTLGTGVINETIEGDAPLIAGNLIIVGLAVPVTIITSIDSGATFDLSGGSGIIGSLSGPSNSIINLGGNTLTTGSLGTNDSYGGMIEGSGGVLTKVGTGALTLSGHNTYSGGTTISAGTLQVENNSALGTGPVVNSATLEMGTTNLSLGGAYTQNTGSTLDLNANSSSNFGSITSTGHAATVAAGSTVNVAVGGYIPNNAALDIINTGGTGITGSAPGTINTNESGTSYYTPRVSFTSSIAGNNLILTANHSTSGFASLADNANGRAAGSVLDNEANPSTDLTNVLNTLEFLSNAKTTAALNTLGPVVDGGVLGSATESFNNFIGASIERAQHVLTLASSGNAESTGVSSGDEAPLNGLWAKQYGGYMDQGTRDGIEGYNAWNTGTALGLDRVINDDLTLGASVGYAYGKVESDANSASSYINSAEGTLYAAYQGQNHPYFIDAAGTFANNWYDGQRSLSVDTIDRTADSDYQGQQYGVYLDGGYKFDVGNNIVLTPLTSLQWTHLTLGGYTETDAGSLDLMVNRQSYNILESGLGASISSQEKYNWGNFVPEFHAKWLYDFINDDMAVTSSFTGGGASFVSTGASPARNAANIGGSLSFDLKNNISLIAGVDTEMRDNFFAVYGSISLRYKF